MQAPPEKMVDKAYLNQFKGAKGKINKCVVKSLLVIIGNCDQQMCGLVITDHQVCGKIISIPIPSPTQGSQEEDHQMCGKVISKTPYICW